MVYNPELLKQLLGERVADLFDGTVTVEPSKSEMSFGNLQVGDKLIFNLKSKPSQELREFVITTGKKNA